MALYEEAKMMRSLMLFFATNMKVGAINLKEICLFNFETIKHLEETSLFALETFKNMFNIKHIFNIHNISNRF